LAGTTSFVTRPSPEPPRDKNAGAPATAARPSQRRAATPAHLTLPSVAASVAQARRFLRGWLGDAAGTRFGEDLALVVSELVSNAIRHSTLSAIHLSRDGERVRVEVDDENGGVPRPVAVLEPDAPSGRGLFIVDRIVTDWGWNRLSDGRKRVWCEMRPSAPMA
jgi:anti-sigma regulatory factor (Ser/Thr protein kinase)